jgi:hypothetical protein
VDPHARREVDAALEPQPVGVGAQVGAQPLAQVQGGPAGAPGVVLVCDRRAEERHDAVAGVLVDGALEAVHAVGQDLEEAVEDPVPRLGIDSLGELHRALHVREHHRHLLALALESGLRVQDLVGEVLGGVRARVLLACVRGDRRRQRGGATVAELLASRVDPPAARTLDFRGQGPRALATEGGVRGVLVSAARAVHRVSRILDAKGPVRDSLPADRSYTRPRRSAEPRGQLVGAPRTARVPQAAVVSLTGVEGMVEIEARVGIHTGPAVVGEMGGAEKPETMVLGDTLNVAARLEVLAEPGTVVISDATLRLVAGSPRPRFFPSESMPSTMITVWSWKTMPSIRSTRMSRSARGAESHSVICFRDRATKRRDTAPFEVLRCF